MSEGAKVVSPQLQGAYGVVKEKAIEGVWVVPEKLVGTKNPIMFKLARMGKINRKYQAQVTRYAQENRRKIQLGLLGVDKQVDKALSIFCHSILLDWQNIKDPHGNIVKYTPERGMYLMTELDDLYQELSSKASDIELFQDTPEFDNEGYEESDVAESARTDSKADNDPEDLGKSEST